MFDIVFGLLREIWFLLLEMAPYLLLGFLVAGILHVLIPAEKISKHLAQNNMRSVIKASLFGIPLPLCSCGVIPVAAHLKRQGANRGPLLSFLVSTPTTGVDSILATYSLLGILFAIVRPVAALFSGLLAGFLSIPHSKKVYEFEVSKNNCVICTDESPHSHTILEKAKHSVKYAFLELVEDVGKWIVLGIIIGGAISYFIPASIIEKYLGNPFLAYPLMLLIGIPLYVCATGSIPMVAPLILKGMTPGAGLIFLFAGPATNTATLSFVGGEMGRKSLITYLTSIIVGSLLFGLLIDLIWNMSGRDLSLITGTMEMLPEWLKISSGIVLVLLILKAMIKKSQPEFTGKGLMISVPGMTCENCKRTLDAAIRKVENVEEVNINLKQKKIEVIGGIKEAAVFGAIQNAGYEISESKTI
jgi:uncharacterized membrane protein YraQ (UPF0718 family)/copper chaperone CopZ